MSLVSDPSGVDGTRYNGDPAARAYGGLPGEAVWKLLAVVTHLEGRLRHNKDLGFPTIMYSVLCQARVWEKLPRFSPRGHRDGRIA